MVEIKENIKCFQFTFYFIYIVFSFIFYRLLSKNLPDGDQDALLQNLINYWKKYESKESSFAYYYSDVYIFQKVEVFNLWLFIIFKLVFQSGYFVCNEIITFKNRKLELIIYSIWSCVFITHVILVFLFDISIFRTAGLIPDEDSYIKSFGIMKPLCIIDIVVAFMILIAHGLKFVTIIINKEQKKYAEFINEDN